MDNLRSMVNLATGLGDDVRALVAHEILLAKQELRELVLTNARAVASFAAAGLLGLLALVFGLITVVLLFPEGVRGWVALGLTVTLLAVAAILALMGRAMLKTDPRELMSGFKEDLDWARRQMKPDER
ncbi:MAG: phage holin family protein [Candidatus Dormibacteria bacterium]